MNALLGVLGEAFGDPKTYGPPQCRLLIVLVCFMSRWRKRGQWPLWSSSSAGGGYLLKLVQFYLLRMSVHRDVIPVSGSQR
jgi:hypothetical protein